MRHPVRHIIIHCSDSPNGRNDLAEDIRRWHTSPRPQGRGWKHAGYHYVIELDGHCAPLVPLDGDGFIDPWEIANGAAGHNHNSIHICLIGTDCFTHAQWSTLYRVVADLRYRLPAVTVHGHYEFNPAKTCPNFDVQEWLRDPDSVANRQMITL